MEKGKQIVVYESRRKKRKAGNIQELPEEIICIILSRLSVRSLQLNARYVCNNWNNIVCNPSFINTKLKDSKAGLLIRSFLNPRKVKFFGINDDGRLDLQDVEDLFPAAWCNRKTIVFNSAGGAILFWDASRRLFVANPVTKQVKFLMRLNKPYAFGFAVPMGMVWNPHTGELKVVIGCWERKSKMLNVMSRTLNGSDGNISWKRIYNSVVEKAEPFNDIVPVCAGSVAYLTCRNPTHNKENIVAIDLDDGTTHSVDVPAEAFPKNKCRAIGDKLCLMKLKDAGPGKLEIDTWVLKDLRRSEWCKFSRLINLGCEVSWIGDCAWFDDNLEIFVSTVKKASEFALVTYHVKTSMTEIFHIPDFGYSLLPHTNSLVKW